MLKNLSICIIFLAIWQDAQTQNLVPNGDFETYTSKPDYYHQSNKATGWFNLNKHYTGPPYASPDYFYDPTFMNSYLGPIKPHGGNGQMGFYTYAKNLVDAREYVSCQLSKTLKVGSTYELSFWLTNGKNGAYTAAVDNFGVHFSSKALEQKTDEVVRVKPQIEIPDTIFHDNYWQLYTFQFVADSQSNYITFGNFETDDSTRAYHGRSSYFFIDDIVLTHLKSDLYVVGDTSICDGQSTTLTAFNSSNPRWVDSLYPSITISTDTSITVSPTSTTTYIIYDDNDTVSITVEVKAYPTADLGNDTAICVGQSIVLTVSSPKSTYLWNDNSRDSTLEVAATGSYMVWVTNQCGIAKDTIHVEVIAPPEIELGEDTLICESGTILLDAYVPNATYKWQDNSTLSNLIVSNGGIYWVEVGNKCGLDSDTIIIDQKDLPKIELGADTTICEGVVLELQLPMNDYTYQWIDFSTKATFIVEEQGVYWVVASNACGSVIDSITIDVSPLPAINLGNDTSICEGDVIRISASSASSDLTYLWHDNSKWSSILLVESGQYWLTATNSCGSVSDTFNLVMKECDCSGKIFIPTAFSPNTDDLNNVFQPVTRCDIASFSMTIYNRWGEKLYYSNDIKVGWDGMYLNQKALPGVYIYILTYQEFGRLEKVVAGRVLLLGD